MPILSCGVVARSFRRRTPRSEGDPLELNGKPDDIQEEHKNGCQSIQRSGQRKPLSHVRKLHDGEKYHGVSSLMSTSRETLAVVESPF